MSPPLGHRYVVRAEISTRRQRAIGIIIPHNPTHPTVALRSSYTSRQNLSSNFCCSGSSLTSLTRTSSCYPSSLFSFSSSSSTSNSCLTLSTYASTCSSSGSCSSIATSTLSSCYSSSSTSASCLLRWLNSVNLITVNWVRDPSQE